MARDFSHNYLGPEDSISINMQNILTKAETEIEAGTEIEGVAGPVAEPHPAGSPLRNQGNFRNIDRPCRIFFMLLFLIFA